VGVRLHQVDHMHAEIVVSDQGPGIPPEERRLVFERFYRADTSRTRASGGTGLGLSIVDSLVYAHGGTVKVTTALGKGSRFTVSLPRIADLPARL
ncbi:two-component sensor histidine kinase, partial [Mycobacterium tuberculosis]|uniref:sensor histidine kinase n=1 Tax=Mycobacterium tuberculosis TaxID=1773 RepID=UPI001006220D